MDDGIHTGFSNRSPEFDGENFGTVAVDAASLAESEIKVTEDLKALAELVAKDIEDPGHEAWVEYAKESYKRHKRNFG